jgi:hypothetical protein
MSNTSKNSILFINKTDLPILVEGWNIVCEGLQELKSVSIDSYEEKTIFSTTNEWNITTYFFDQEMIKKWKENNLKIGNIIGNFSSIPSYSGEYSWVYDELFDIIYDNNKILFLYKK